MDLGSLLIKLLLNILLYNSGDRQGYCPVPDAYESKCNGFRDQCMDDTDCTDEGQKCCSDGDTRFCVKSVNEGKLLVYTNFI